jgi:predicted nucleotidyltransferase component of viral defense system
MIAPKYRDQVDLMIQLLPHISKEPAFALKGGTAINLFVRNLPRLSVDIDLTYLSFDSRDIALKNIQEALGRIKKNLESAIAGISVLTVPLNQGTDVKLNCQYNNAQIKIEVNTVTRGHFLPARLMQLTDVVQEEFGKFAAIQVVSHAELFGGKICAAIDRQHPRDLFDVKLLLDSEGFIKEVRHGLIVSMLSHYKPIHELLSPIFKDQKSAFEAQFAGMSELPFTYSDYENTRLQLKKIILQSFSLSEKKLIYGFECGTPDWDLLPYNSIKNLPAVKWKLMNIHKLMKENPSKHHAMTTLLEKVLY